MKNTKMIKIALAFSSASLLVFSSCKKEEEVSNTSGFAKSSALQVASTKAFYCDPDNVGTYPCGPKTNCDEEGNDCLVASQSISLGMVEQLDNAIINKTVPKFFKDSIKVSLLFPLLITNTTVLSQIQNGVVTLKRVKLADPANILYTLHNANTGILVK
jgi:hypothetical protein